MKTKGLLDYFNRLFDLLDNHPPFEDILALIKKLEKESDMNNSTYVMIDDTEHADWIKYLLKMRRN